MVLTRIWKPSPHNSARSGSVRLIVIHTTEGATTIDSLGNWFANPSAKVSSHVGADNHRQGQIGEYVKRDRSAWTQGNFNSACVSCEMCTPAGAAMGWSRDYWLTKQGWMLDNTAAWIAEEAAKFGIPITKISASSAQGSGRGVCGHVDLGSAGGGHTDPGPGFPWDYVISKASGGKPPTSSPPASGSRPPLHVDYLGRNHYSTHGDVRVWQQKMQSWGWFTQAQVDGIFGPNTESVAKRFQAQQGLSQDGLVGQRTWDKTWP
jgi:N-acetyl-anhydromuramyl-L-alanine amidase AmpD